MKSSRDQYHSIDFFSIINILLPTVLLFFLQPVCAGSIFHTNDLLDSGASRPNILLIIADDITWSDFGFTGNTDVTTPNLDKLAHEGIKLTHVFSSSPVCAPARHALYTGLYPVRNGAYPNHSRLYSDTKTVFTYLKEEGYRVGLQGKSHVAPDKAFPFEHFDRGVKDNFKATRKFITKDSRPWFLVFASADAHRPWTRSHGPMPLAKKLKVPDYLHDNIDTREELSAYYAEINKLDWQVGKLMNVLEETGQTDNTVVLFISEQGSDFPFGGKWSLSDNGIRAVALARYPGVFVERSSTNALIQYVDFTPTILELAGIDPARIDTGNTDALGNKNFDGRNFISVLKSEKNSLREYIFAQMTTVGIKGYKESYPIRAVRDKRYKYIRNLQPQNQFNIEGIHSSSLLASWVKDAKGNPALAKRINRLYERPLEELYDLENDALETVNLISDVELAGRKVILEKELENWMLQQGDKGIETELNARSRISKKRWERLLKLGALASRQGNIQEAIEYIEDALQKEDDFAANSADRARAQYQLAGYYQLQGKNKEALSLLNEAIKIWQVNLSQNANYLSKNSLEQRKQACDLFFEINNQLDIDKMNPLSICREP